MGKFQTSKFPEPNDKVLKKKGSKLKKLHVKSSKTKDNATVQTNTQDVKEKTEDPLESIQECEKVGDFFDLKVEVVKSKEGKEFVRLVHFDCDLFDEDDFKARYEQFNKFDLLFVTIDEVALEGLDGITIEALWKRIKDHLSTDYLPFSFKTAVWKYLCLNENVEFFELINERDELVIPPKENIGVEFHFMSMEKAPDIYKVQLDRKDSTILGSCVDLDTRKNITEKVRKMPLNEAIRTYHNRLVIVANEETRKNALVDDLFDPNYEFGQIEYCLMERVGRMRHIGGITAGFNALTAAFGIDPRSLFHYCLKFDQEHLMVRQSCFVRTMGSSKNGKIIHLRRFYERKYTTFTLTLAKLINYLKKCPNFRAPLSLIKKAFGLDARSKFFKHQDIAKYLILNIHVPYKDYYKGASKTEYMLSNATRERTVQLVSLKDPFVNYIACCNDNIQQDEEVVEDEENVTFETRGRRCINRDLFCDIYQSILKTGNEGLRVADLLKEFDIDFPALRIMLKKLQARKLIFTRKKDIGKQTVYQYIAVCHGNTKVPANESRKISRPSVLERLKKRQEETIANLPRNNIYTKELFEQDTLKNVDSNEYYQPIFEIPNISCNFLTPSVITLLQHIQAIDIFLVNIAINFKKFEITLTLPEFSGNTIKFPKIDCSVFNEKHAFCIQENTITKNFKPDYFTKAFLIKILVDNAQISENYLLDFLDPNKSSKPQKRRLKVEQKVEVQPIVESVKLGVHMGSNPVLHYRSSDEETGLTVEVYSSRPAEGYQLRKGNISNYKNNQEVKTARVISRIAFILKTVQTQTIYEELSRLVRAIQEKEAKEGYEKKIDRKSLHRILGLLIDEGYIRIYSVSLSKGASTKTQTFVCHPEVEFEDSPLQERLAKMKDKSLLYVSNSSIVVEIKNISPFAEDEVQRSLREIKELINAKNPGKLMKKFRRRPQPKFTRSSIIHEMLFYLIYELDKNTAPLPLEKVVKLFRDYNIHLTEEELKTLPPVYSNEISWKTFIPPLPRHGKWGQGWTLLVDIILRMPICVTRGCFSIPYVVPELEAILQHPVKRFYRLAHLSQTIRFILMHRRKYIHDVYNQMVLLAYLGLLQFGPASAHNKEKSFIYLNRNASLYDTTTSRPEYFMIEDKPYPKKSFHFESAVDVRAYWSTMYNFCTQTNLSLKLPAEGREIIFVHTSAKPSLTRVTTKRTQADVDLYDDGELPGDRRGAGGLDTSLWSHLIRNWVNFGCKHDYDSACIKKSTVTKKLPYDKLQLPPTKVSNKHYISNVSASCNPPVRKLAYLKTAKHRPFVKRTVPIRKKRDPKSHKHSSLDAVDRQTLRKFGGHRYRPSWTEHEDRTLVLLKIASVFVAPGSDAQCISYSTLRDVLHLVDDNSHDKTSRSVANRMKLLKRSVPQLSNIETFIPNLYSLEPIVRYFGPYRKYVRKEVKDGKGYTKRFRLSDTELQNAFIFLTYYFMEHRTEVEVAFYGKNISIDYLKRNDLDEYLSKLELVDRDPEAQWYYSNPQNKKDVRMYTLKNTIHSALVYQKNRSVRGLQMYKLYQKFSDDLLRSTILSMRLQRMIQSKKKNKHFFKPYLLSVYYIFAQNTMFQSQTMEEAFMSFLELSSNPDEIDFSYGPMGNKLWGQMFAFNEILSFTHNDATIDLRMPEFHLVLNPHIKNHSDIIEELAKRYLAKMKDDARHKDIFQDLLEEYYNKCDEEEQVAEEEPTLPAQESEELEIIDEEQETEELVINDKETMDNLRSWISDCVDTQRVRSPSPELLYLDSKIKSEEKSETSLSKGMDEEPLLTLDEIKEGMMRPYVPGEKRKVPYILELCKLLTFSYEHAESDERSASLLKKHFVQEYPRLTRLKVSGLKDHYVCDYLENRTGIRDIWHRAARDIHVKIPQNMEVALDKIVEMGGIVEDVDVAQEILVHTYNKNVMGVPGYELKELFSESCYLALESILNILVDHGLIIKTGVCTLTFVHHKYQDPWLTDTFLLTPEQQAFLLDDDTEDDENVSIEKVPDISESQWIKIKIAPWCTPDGTLNKEVFRLWLTQVFSHCVENPMIRVVGVFNKFCYLKPVDVFYLLEILDEVGCIELRVQSVDEALFSEISVDYDRKATFLDKFEEMYVEVNNLSFSIMGSFLKSME